MASFDIAVNLVITAEGGDKITNDQDDAGKLTKFGISQKSYPLLDIRNLTRDQAIEIYRRDYWASEYDQIIDQKIANKLLSFAVLMWKKPAHVCLQRAVRAASGRVLALDGMLGAETIAAVNACKPEVLLAAFKSEGAAFLRAINNPKFQAGWQNRSYA